METIGFKKLFSGIALAAALVVPTMLPADAMAQGRGPDRGRSDRGRRPAPARRHDDRGRDDRRGDDRQKTKNEWRNLGLAGGAAGVAGLLTGNRTLAALGLGGGLYSAYRYEEDRKSQNRDAGRRYELFRRPAFDYGGHHYERRTRRVDGRDHYYFQRTR
jgi:hypothetical protein